MKFSGKICFEKILKVRKNQGFNLSLDDTFFEKPQEKEGRGGGGGGGNSPPPPHNSTPPPRHIRVKTKINPNFTVKLAGKSNHSFLLSV